MIKIIIGIGMLLSMNLFASFDEGQIEYKKGNIKLASEHYTKGCKDGDPYSCIELGKLYASGKGIKLKTKKAKKIFTKYCKKGYTGSCYQLGVMHYLGNGVEINKKKAKGAFGIACTYGHEQACTMYRKLDSQMDLHVIKK
ncbi:MAG: sel1 repeat family protein [Campylobacteraceae bacterium]|jgi:TPR repeat protein|nr:sel1 repeat family protein [Campylobacteraceae bacterium]MBT4572541.1 sel1 repeat family protein [Campylobacteraceae bacterium]MBT6106969.1 sel1 repeat family protein [Campylobacteraceae bacterium]MBT7116790.1 sel1 repeat family protein [Campylobacteraceae bacterium]